MAVPAAPLTGRDMMQPEQALRLERQVLPGLEEVDAAALVDGAAHVDPAAVPCLQSNGHDRAVPSLRHCI
jgi:hypothetical protein